MDKLRFQSLENSYQNSVQLEAFYHVYLPLFPEFELLDNEQLCLLYQLTLPIFDNSYPAHDELEIEKVFYIRHLLYHDFLSFEFSFKPTDNSSFSSSITLIQDDVVSNPLATAFFLVVFLAFVFVLAWGLSALVGVNFWIVLFLFGFFSLALSAFFAVYDYLF